MLEMKSCADIAKYSDILPDDCLAPMIVESVDGDNVQGFVIFEYDKNLVVIHALGCGDDLALCDGLVRTALFKGLMSGILQAKFNLGDDEKSIDMCRKLRFFENTDDIIDIDDVLGGCKGCANK